jgi:hypothetical protein
VDERAQQSGTGQLLEEGARLCETAADALDEPTMKRRPTRAFREPSRVTMVLRAYSQERSISLRNPLDQR